MDIAKVGIGIDPTSARQGAKAVKDSLKQVGDTAKRELSRVDKAADQAGGKTKRLAKVSRGAFADMSRGIMDFLDAFGLMDNGFGRMIRRTDSAARASKNLGGMMGRTGVSAATGAAGLNSMATGAKAAAGGFGAMAAAAAPLLAALAAILAAVLAVVAAWKGLVAGFSLLKKGIGIENSMEKARVQFAILLGSFDAAEERLKLLRDFAASTPFEFPGISAASRTMQVFTQGALATEEGLKLVGDAAAAAGRPLDEVSMWVGRLYAGLKGGQPIGEATMRLMEMGLIVPQLKGHLDALAEKSNKGGKNFAEIWAMAEASLKRYAGTMEVQSKTFNGLVSTLRDEWNELARQFGAPMQVALKPVLEDLIALVKNLQPYAKRFGEILANGFKALYQAFNSGELTNVVALAISAGIEQAKIIGLQILIKMFEVVYSNMVKVAIFALKSVVNIATGLFSGVVDLIARLFGVQIGNASETSATGFGEAMKSALEYVGKAAWNILGQALEDVVNVFYSGFMDVWRKIADKIAPSMAAMGKSIAPVPPGGKVDFFTPSELPDLGKVASGLIGTGKTDALKSKVGELLKQYQTENPALKLPATATPIDVDMMEQADGKKKKAKAPPKAKIIQEPFRELMLDWEDVRSRIVDQSVGMAQSVSQNLTGSIADFVEGTKSAKQAFSDMANAILSDLLRMTTQMWINAALAKALGGSNGAISMGLGALPGVAHTGAVVGGDSVAKAPTFHTGGTSTSESMVKVERGESILTRRRGEEMEAALNRKTESGSRRESKGPTILNVTDQRQILDVIAANPDVVVNAIGRRQPAIRRLAGSKESF